MDVILAIEQTKTFGLEYPIGVFSNVENMMEGVKAHFGNTPVLFYQQEIADYEMITLALEKDHTLELHSEDGFTAHVIMMTIDAPL